MNKIYRRKWYTYQELLSPCDDAPVGRHLSSNASNWFQLVLDELSMHYEILGVNENITDGADIINALMTLVYDRHGDDYVYHLDFDFFSDEVDTYQLTTDDLKTSSFFNNLLSIIELTAPRYLPLFIQYKEHGENPIGAISSSNTLVSRFNDTPQNGGDYSNDEHTTNITQNTSSSTMDVGTLMSRLEEMYKNFHSIIRDWSDEFNSLFYKEEQLS